LDKLHAGQVGRIVQSRMRHIKAGCARGEVACERNLDFGGADERLDRAGREVGRPALAIGLLAEAVIERYTIYYSIRSYLS